MKFEVNTARFELFYMEIFTRINPFVLLTQYKTARHIIAMFVSEMGIEPMIPNDVTRLQNKTSALRTELVCADGMIVIFSSYLC